MIESALEHKISCIEERLSEHQRVVFNSQSVKSTLAEHVCQTSHAIARDNSIIPPQQTYRYAQRRCLEAWDINMNQHAMNRADGSYLPQEYLHLLWEEDVTYS